MRGNELPGGGLRSPADLLVVIRVSLVCTLILELCFSSPAELLLFCFFFNRQHIGQHAAESVQ